MISKDGSTSTNVRDNHPHKNITMKNPLTIPIKNGKDLR